MNYITLFKNTVYDVPKGIALVDIDGTRQTTYEALDELSGKVAGKIRQLGIDPGSFVVINIDRRMEYMAAYLGVLKAGCAVVPLGPDTPVQRMDYIKAHCESPLTINESFFKDINQYDTFESLSEDTAPALLIYTSGSTGTPKGILYTVADISRAVQRQAALFDGLSPINFAGACRFSFIAHLTEYLTVFYLGGCTHILSHKVCQSVALIEEYYEKHQITSGILIPLILKRFRSRSSALKRVITGSERVSQLYYEDFEIYNVYGMSEIGHISTFKIDGFYDNTPVGKALPGVEFIICDEKGHILPQGSEGEIGIIAESGITYFKDPTLSKRCMRPLNDGKTLYLTNDIGMLDIKGNLIYLDRQDWMVKIRGFRVDTLEIETLLREMPEIDEVVVKAFGEENGVNYLVAYYCTSFSDIDDVIRDRLQDKIPQYMMPRFFVKMAELPRNSNGKIDRNALIPPINDLNKQHYSAPLDETEKAICHGFELVLDCDLVGINDDFFALGGDSIKALELIDVTDIQGMTPDKILIGKTPKKIAVLCNETKKKTIPHNEVIPEICPLTESQKGVYLECINEPASLKYNIASIMDLPPQIDGDRFIEAVKKVILSHQVFQIWIGTPQGIPSMIRHHWDIEIPEKEVESLEEEIRSFIRPFDFESEPLFRFEICTSPTGRVFLYDIHHIIFDGYSATAFMRQIAEVYNGGSVTEEGLTIFDISAAEKNLKDTDIYREAQNFFKEKFEDVDCDSKPIPDQLLEVKHTSSGRLVLNSEQYFCTGEVENYVKKHKVTENAFFMAAFAYTLGKFNGMTESSFCTGHNGRKDPRLMESVGMFVKSLPVHYAFDEKMRIVDFVSMVYDDFYGIKQHDCISFGELAAQYGVGIAITFLYHGAMINGVTFGGTTLYPELVHMDDIPLELDLTIRKTDEDYELMSRYKRELYTEALVKSFAKLYFKVVHGFLNKERLEEIQLTDIWDIRHLESLNATEKDYRREKTVVDLFREQAGKSPDQVCVVFKDRQWTYGQVDVITDKLAMELKTRGVGKEKVVGILIHRNEYMVIGALGVLKAGGAYLPLDPSYPPERLNLMMQDSGAMMLIADPDLDAMITNDFTGIRLSTEIIPTLNYRDFKLGSPDVKDLFVMLYTSGSTGKPKGVMFEHGNMMVTAEWVKDYFDLNETSKVTAYASFGFDAHAFDQYSALISGATLHIIPEELRLDLPALRYYFNENRITHTVMTMQLGRQFALMGGFNTLKYLSVAGEKLTPLDPPTGLTMNNLYGPTEGSVVTSAFVIDEHYKDVPIGKAVDNLKVYVVDKNHKLLPTGVVGELWISGPHVTRGYLNRPDKTEEAYGENPFVSLSSEETKSVYNRVYRTGDIVRLMDDGNLQFIGRRDAQVKVRGYRIELTEVEEVIRRYPNIDDVTVAAFKDPSGASYVAAYVVSHTAIDQDALAEFIRSEKPAYMVPAVFMQIDAIPLTQNGKVNKRALPEPQRQVGEIIPPETALQKQLFDIVAEVVDHIAFGIYTDFYEAGLTSIGAVKLNVLLAETFDIPIRIADIQSHNTIKKLANFISAAAPQAEYELLSDYPISQTQAGIFVECLSMPDTTVYNIPLLIRLGENVEIEKLIQAIRAAMDAHPYVKMTLFTDEDGNIRAARHDQAKVEIPVISCETLTPVSELVKPFTLVGNPLYRVAIYVTESDRYLFMDFHHIISDGTSEAILLRDIDRAYGGEILEPEKYSGFEAGLDEAIRRSGDPFHEAAEYWKNTLSGCETDCLPKAASEDPEGGANTYRYLSSSTASDIKAFCEKHGITGNAFFNGLFAFVMGKFGQQESMTHATVFNGRSDSRLAEAVTMLVRTVPVVTDLSLDRNIVDYLQDMQTQLMNSMSHDACSYAELSNQYGVKADMILVYQGDDFQFDNLCGEKAEFITLESETAKSPVSVSVFQKGQDYEYVVEYRRDLFSLPFVQSLVASLETASKAFTTCETLNAVDLLSEGGKKIYEQMNATYQPIENKCYHQYLEGYAKTQPDAPAVIVARETLTYRELNAAANKVAHALVRAGVRRDQIIGMVLDRSVAFFMGEFGILKAGGAYLPMIPGYPDDRIDFCLRDADSPLVITTEAIKAERAELFGDNKPYKTLTIEEMLSYSEDEDLNLEITPDQLAYCIYTSGSTGRPKGVMLEHHNLSNFIQTAPVITEQYASEDFSGVVLANIAVTFDASVYERTPAFYAGDCVCMTTEEEIHDPMALKELIIANHVEAMTATTSLLVNLVSMPEFHPVFQQMKVITQGGEHFPPSLCAALKAINPELILINGYGPTECTICTSTKVLSPEASVTIGSPNPNVKYYVMDKKNHILPPYALGELIICGEVVGRGYVKLPEKNKAVFFNYEGLPAYRSGDMVRMNGDGEIECIGRMDNQVKLRGFRIELDEIEKVMTDYEPVTQSKVIVRNNGSEDYLAGFFTAKTQVDLDALTEYLKSSLTYYMVPAALMQLDAMPLTPHGKIDKKALPEIKQAQKKKTGRRVPKKSLEQRLCEIFSSVLGLEEVYADDNFFEMGGTSLTASKVTMILMSENIDVKYGDIFDHPTPEELAEFIEQRDNVSKVLRSDAGGGEKETITRSALQWNTTKYAKEVKRESLGNVLLTGATGFLGIHVFKELLEIEEGHIYCLMRKGNYDDLETRLKTLLFYYFSDQFEKQLNDRVTFIEGDITLDTLSNTLKDVPFDTLINCAACVKHFTDSDILERINVQGVENLIDLCQQKNAKLIQISTVSVPGIHTEESYEKQVKMHENELFVIDDMDNKYGISKYHAELKMLDAIDNGLRGKIIRVGNLMGRHSDGEFQANMSTNMFLRGIRGFAIMGKYPISHMTDPMRFSPVDCTARAIVMLAGTNDKFTAFNADNRYGFDEMKIIDACNRNGIAIYPEEDEVYYAEFKAKLGDDSINEELNGLAAYDIQDAHAVETDNLFTTNILYRIGFSWPLVDDAYLDRAIDRIMGLDFFN